jgi:plasmid stabilization system protein ParE
LPIIPAQDVNARSWLATSAAFAIGNYVIFYLPTQDGIDVVRVLHGARDISPDDLS